jgi:DNA invertase Pin-like site-specific DNA recombinase
LLWEWSGKEKRIDMTNKEHHQKPYKAVIYCRVASDNPVADRANSLAGQEQCCHTYAATNGYSILSTFRDVGSGVGKSRPGFDKMLAFLDEHRDEKYRVLIADPKRLARDAEIFLVLGNKIREAGGSIEMAGSGRTIADRFPGRLSVEKDRER